MVMLCSAAVFGCFLAETPSLLRLRAGGIGEPPHLNGSAGRSPGDPHVTSLVLSEWCETQNVCECFVLSVSECFHMIIVNIFMIGQSHSKTKHTDFF